MKTGTALFCFIEFGHFFINTYGQRMMNQVNSNRENGDVTEFATSLRTQCKLCRIFRWGFRSRAHRTKNSKPRVFSAFYFSLIFLLSSWRHLKGQRQQQKTARCGTEGIASTQKLTQRALAINSPTCCAYPRNSRACVRPPPTLSTAAVFQRQETW